VSFGVGEALKVVKDFVFSLAVLDLGESNVLGVVHTCQT